MLLKVFSSCLPLESYATHSMVAASTVLSLALCEVHNEAKDFLKLSLNICMLGKCDFRKVMKPLCIMAQMPICLLALEHNLVRLGNFSTRSHHPTSMASRLLIRVHLGMYVHSFAECLRPLFFPKLFIGCICRQVN